MSDYITSLESQFKHAQKGLSILLEEMKGYKSVKPGEAIKVTPLELTYMMEQSQLLERLANNLAVRIALAKVRETEGTPGAVMPKGE